MITAAENSINRFDASTPTRSFPVRYSLLIGLAILALCTTLIYSRVLVAHLAEINESYIIPARELKTQAALAHLWAEEAITGDEEISPVMVRDYFDNVEQKTNSLINDIGSGWRQRRLSNAKEILELLAGIKQLIATNREIAAERLANPELSQPGSPPDQRQDAAFESLLAQLTRFDEAMASVVSTHHQRVRLIQAAMIGLTLILGFAAALLTFRFEKQRLGDLKVIVGQNTELQALNQQLLATEQQLRASNQQLLAADQQLRAYNQQLLATEQQLRASNEQLSSSEHQLREKNKELIANQQILEANERRYRTLVGNMAEGVAIHQLEYDSDGNPVDYRILEVNRQYETILGYQSNEATGRLATDLYGTDSAPYLNEYAEVARGGPPIRFETYFPPMDRYFSISASSFEPGHFATVFIDITEQKRNEEAIRLNEARLESLLEISQSQVTAQEQLYEDALRKALQLTRSNHGGIFVYNPNSAQFIRTAVICRVRQKCGNLEKNGLCGLENLGLLDEVMQSRTPILLNDSRSLAGNSISDSELQFNLKRCLAIPVLIDGVVRVVILLADKDLPYESADVRQTTLLMDSVLRIADRRRAIEERFQMEVQLQKLESLGVLAGGIAHDFNNMLTAVLANINLTAQADLAENERKKRLTEAERATIRAKGLAQQLLTFARGGAPVKKAMLLPELITETATFAVRGSPARCIFNFAVELWPVEIDGGQIGQVVNNLVLNAAQAMPNGGVVEISAENVVLVEDDEIPLPPGKYVRLSFEDHGVGIPTDLIPKIFDPYFTTKDQGNGLGLAASHAIVLKHQGYIQAKSEIGKGTTITMHLPATQAVLAKAEAQPSTPATKGGRVLVMDDEIALRDLLAVILKKAGYTPTLAANGEEALEAFQAANGCGQAFDLVILDLTVAGGMGGKETLDRLMVIDPRVKAIVCSGYSNNPIMADFRTHGFKGFIAKPYTMKDMLQEIHRVESEAG